VTRTLSLAKTSLSAALAVMAVSSLGLAQDPLAPEGSTPPAAPADPAERPLDPAPPELEKPAADAPPSPSKQEPRRTVAKPPLADPTEEADPTLPVREGVEPSAAQAQKSWFYRDPLKLQIGNRMSIRWYGVVQADFIYDTTRSYGDTIGQSLVAREDTYEGTVGRFQASSRSTRFGMAVDAKTIGGVTPSAVIEGDFAGDQPTNDTGSSERSYYDSPSFRVRHAYLNLANDYVDVLIGQTDDVFGWQNTPSSVSRHTQLRLSHSFLASSPVGLDVAAAAVRPAQRDSRIPDGQAGVRLTINRWKGIYARDGIPSARKLSIGVSGVARQFDVDAFTPPPTQTSNKVVGWGVSVDAMLPIIPAKDEFDRSNALTFAGSYVRGTGIGDLVRVDGGAEFPPLPNPARASPAPEYEANVDDGLVSFDRLGVLNTIDWEGFRVDGQYYFPGGRVRLAAIYTQAYSKNMAALYPQGGAEIDLITHIADRVRYIEGNLYWDVTPEVRFQTAGIYTTVTYLDGQNPHNIRGKFTAYYFF
jgi:hypothetical protein